MFKELIEKYKMLLKIKNHREQLIARAKHPKKETESGLLELCNIGFKGLHRKDVNTLTKKLPLGYKRKGTFAQAYEVKNRFTKKLIGIFLGFEFGDNLFLVGMNSNTFFYGHKSFLKIKKVDRAYIHITKHFAFEGSLKSYERIKVLCDFSTQKTFPVSLNFSIEKESYSYTYESDIKIEEVIQNWKKHLWYPSDYFTKNSI